MKCRNLLMITILIGIQSLFISASDASPESKEKLKYQDRGNRWEGIRWMQSSSKHIELLAAMANHDESQNQTEVFKVKFYIEEVSDVYLTVREIDNRKYYWLDKIKQGSWKQGFGNVFEWPIGDVFKKIDEIGMQDLGIVARIGYEKPKKEETIAPAIFFQNHVPDRIVEYLFAFKPARNARVTCSMFKNPKSGKPILIKEDHYPKVIGGRPFTFLWDCSNADEGHYELMVSGYFRDNNKRLSKSVIFYHQPNVN